MSVKLINNLSPHVGFMQGRLSKPTCGKIQEFPWRTWKDEFHHAKRLGFQRMEWTIDYDELLLENPIMSESGRSEINELSRSTGCMVESITADCIMQFPFWKLSQGIAVEERFRIADEVINSAIEAKIKILVIPAVDQASIANSKEEKMFIDFFENRAQKFVDNKLKVAIESDYPPEKLGAFLVNLHESYFGVNYDIGNSASCGFVASKEFDCYGQRIINIHIKDRLLRGSTVPLGQGAADFEYIFKTLTPAVYAGNWIFQTARTRNGEDIQVMIDYLNHISQFSDWMLNDQPKI